MLPSPHKCSLAALFTALFLSCLLLLGSRQSVRAQSTTLSRPEVDRMLYVSNAFETIERRNTPELVALAFYINATYQNFPDYPPDRLLPELQNATARYNAYYRSATTPDQTRFAIAPYESIVYMLGILASLPGERDTVARQFISREAVNFGSLLDNATYLSEAIPPGGNSAPVGVFQSGSVLGLGRGQEFYLRYRKQQLYALYDLARSNAPARKLIDGYFGAFFQASVLNSGAQILAANPTFANSVNFQRIAPYFNWDTSSPQYGTFTIDAATLAALLSTFQTDALQATQQLSTALNTVYNTYQRNYAAYSLDPVRQQAAADAMSAPLTAFNQKLQGLSGFANVVDLTFPSLGDDTQSKTAAGLNVASGLLYVGAGMASSGLKGKSGILTGILGLAGAAMGFASAFGLDTSPPSPSNAELADGLNQLNQNLRTVSQDLANRINTLDTHLIALYRATSEGFNTVLHDIAVVNAGITQIQEDARYLIYLAQSNQAQLYNLTQSIYAFFNAYNQDQRLPLRGYLATLDNVLRNDPDTLIYNEGINGFYNTLRNYATLNAMSQTEVGSFGATNEDYSPERLRTVLNLYSGTPEQTLNYLCGYADRLVNTPPYSLGLPGVRSPLQSSDLGGYLVNEPAWEMCVAGLLRLDAALPTAFVAATRNDGPANSNSHFGMRSLGRNLQRTAANVTLQFRAATDNSQPSPRYFPSPRLSTLTTDYNTKATNFVQKVSALKQTLPGSHIAIAAGTTWSLMVRPDGTVWASGDNREGQLGDGTRTDRLTPVRASGLTGVVSVAGAFRRSLALKSDGTVWAWGSTEGYGLGDGTTVNRLTPVQVSGLTGVTAIVAGDFHSLALKSDGTVWAWGGGGRLGDGTTTNRLVPVPVSGLTGVTAIAAGSNHSLALKSDGTVWVWGYNRSGQLGISLDSSLIRLTPVQVSSLTGVIAIAAGDSHSLAVKSDRTVRAWGANWNGQLGDGSRTDRFTPVTVSGLTGVKTIAAGPIHTLAMKSDGTVWTWGRNSERQLGDGTTIDRWTPVPVSGMTGVASLAGGLYHSVALRYDGTVVWGWGDGGYGQFGNGLNFYYTPFPLFSVPDSVARPYIRAYILDIVQRYLNGTGGARDYSFAQAAELYTAFRDMQNARTVLERFLSLGLSRSLTADTLPRALLYANVTDPYPTDPVTGAANPNYGKVLTDCQRLPDMDWITALYDAFAQSTDPDPQDLITTALPVRVSALQNYLTPVLQNLADEANARRYYSPDGPVTGQLVLGEPLANVELMLRRFDAFTMTKVTGTVRATDTNATPLLRKLEQYGFSIQVALRNNSVAEPILTFPIHPDANGVFTFTLPDGVFDVLIKAPGFLQRIVRANTSNSASATVNVVLIPGDIDGDNQIGRVDVALMQRALGSVAMKRNWNPRADLNGDGRVDGVDEAILRQQVGRIGDRF